MNMTRLYMNYLIKSCYICVNSIFTLAINHSGYIKLIHVLYKNSFKCSFLITETLDYSRNDLLCFKTSMKHHIHFDITPTLLHMSLSSLCVFDD